MSNNWRLWTVAAALLTFGAQHGTSEAQSANGGGLEPWASNTDPTDAAKRHVEEISAGRHEYAITQGGTMDGQNCRSPFGVFEGVELRWESNRAVRIENVGAATQQFVIDVSE